MHTFHLISKKIVDLDEKTFLFTNIHKINFFIFLQKDYSIKNKFLFLNETIENIFNTEKIKEDFFDYFSKIQKSYNAFSRLAYLYKYKKAKIMVNTDLIMNEIKENEKYVYCLFQNNCKYLFKIHELIKIIDNSIANSCEFFSNPISIKNPYNNIILNKSTLYNIYFFIQTKTILHSEIFYYFFKTNFNLNDFTKQYQYLLRNFSIQSYLTNSNQDVIIDNVGYMIDEYNTFIKKREKQIIIDHTFPKDLLINIMKPYLELFLKSQYSLLYTYRVYCKRLLREKLIDFNKFNPLFGRKNYIIKKSFFPNKISTFEYNTKHISFYNSDNNQEQSTYMTSHINNISEDRDSDSESDDDHDDDISEESNTIFSVSVRQTSMATRPGRLIGVYIDNNRDNELTINRNNIV
jgi:hypothetical protein